MKLLNKIIKENTAKKGKQKKVYKARSLKQNDRKNKNASYDNRRESLRMNQIPQFNLLQETDLKQNEAESFSNRIVSGDLHLMAIYL